MYGIPEHPSPALAAQLDWMTQGEFNPERFTGDQRKQYDEERQRIEQQWDNNRSQPWQP